MILSCSRGWSCNCKSSPPHSPTKSVAFCFWSDLKRFCKIYSFRRFSCSRCWSCNSPTSPSRSAGASRADNLLRGMSFKTWFTLFRRFSCSPWWMLVADLNLAVWKLVSTFVERTHQSTKVTPQIHHCAGQTLFTTGFCSEQIHHNLCQEWRGSLLTAEIGTCLYLLVYWCCARIPCLWTGFTPNSPNQPLDAWPGFTEFLRIKWQKAILLWCQLSLVIWCWTGLSHHQTIRLTGLHIVGTHSSPNHPTVLPLASCNKKAASSEDSQYFCSRLSVPLW